MLETGEKAAPFSLPDHDGSQVSLGDFEGSWLVLYFYPKDNTPGCTTEACDFTESIEDFKGLEARVVGVSPDSARSHSNFIEKHKLAITLLSDPEHKVIEAYGAWQKKKMYGREYWGVQRSTVLIDPQGTLAYHWPKVSVKGHVSEVKDKLAELRE